MTTLRMRTCVRCGVGSFLLAAALTAVACSGEAVQSTPAPSGRGGGGLNAAVPVTTASVVQKTTPITVEGIGTVIAASTVSVHAQITGELTSVNFKEGEDVTQGQVIVTLDRRPLEAALQQAQANLERDLAQAANARAQAARAEDLAGRGIVTREQLDPGLRGAHLRREVVRQKADTHGSRGWVSGRAGTRRRPASDPDSRSSAR